MLTPPRSLHAWFTGAGLFWIAGCGSLLGLEDRNVDDSELGAGYAGCTPGGACDGCINQSHYDACRAGGSDVGGAGGTSNGGNAGNGGDGGNSNVSNVTTDSGGAGGGVSGASNAGGNSGAAGLGGVSSTSGGTGGEPGVCADDLPVSDSCDSCLCDTCRGELEQCAVDAGCLNIWTCFEEHACDPNPGVENSCFDAERCQTAIMNNGGPEGAPLGRLQDLLGCAVDQCDCGNENCTTDNGCDCATCEEACECAGYPEDYCANTCSNGPVQCGSAGPGACLGCAGCVSQCICGGTSEFDCMVACDVSTCTADDCSACDNPSDACVCESTSASPMCSEAQLGASCSDYYGTRAPEQFDCSVCGCENCPALNTRCEFDPFGVDGVPGCVALLECLEATGCAGEECAEASNCGDLLNRLDGLQGYSMQIAEGLLACRNAHDCPSCGPSGGASVTCGTETCFAYEEPFTELAAPACCAGNDTNLCGYELGAFFPTPQGACFPANAPGGNVPGCPGAQVETDTYSAYLSGCCMPMNGSCGLLETRIGLGCVPHDVVGQPMPNPAVVCSP